MQVTFPQQALVSHDTQLIGGLQLPISTFLVRMHEEEVEVRSVRFHYKLYHIYYFPLILKLPSFHLINTLFIFIFIFIFIGVKQIMNPAISCTKGATLRDIIMKLAVTRIHR